jgi:hypothetical protein
LESWEKLGLLAWKVLRKLAYLGFSVTLISWISKMDLGVRSSREL